MNVLSALLKQWKRNTEILHRLDSMMSSALIFVFISLSINVLRLIVLSRVRYIGDTINHFLKSLIVSDILTSLLREIPANAAAVRNVWPFGDLVCLLITIPHDTIEDCSGKCTQVLFWRN